jgi:O-antigen/teichoic acid export membrane protein
LAGGSLSVLLWAHCFGFGGLLLAQLLVARHQERSLASLLIAAAVLNVGLNLWAIPRYGAIGAAWASLAAYSLPFVAGSVFGGARSAVRLCLRACTRPLAGGAVLLAILLILRPGLTTALVLTGVAWPAILLLTRSTSWSEVTSMVHALMRRPAADPPPTTG